MEFGTDMDRIVGPVICQNINVAGVDMSKTWVRTEDFALGIAARLRALMDDMELPSVQAFADYVGNGCLRTQASNWLNGYNLPPISMLYALSRKAGVTIDWLVYGNMEGMEYGKAIRLQARLDGMRIPSIPSEPSAKVDYLAGSSRKRSASLAEKRSAPPRASVSVGAANCPQAAPPKRQPRRR